MEIEFIDEKHLLECAQKYMKTFNSDPWNDNWSEITAYKRLEDIFNTPGFVGLVVIIDGSIMGAVFGSLETWFEGYMYNLKEMFVIDGKKGKGIGSRLFTAIESEISNRGAKYINLFTSKGDLTEKFYIKNGCRTFDGMIMMSKTI